MNFAQEHLRPVGCYLSAQAHALGIEFEPFQFEVDGEFSEQDEPELDFNGFQLPTSDLAQLVGKKFDIQTAPERCEGSIYLSVQMVGEHYWVDLISLEFGNLVDNGIETKIHVRFVDLYFANPTTFEHTISTLTRLLPDEE